MKKKYKFGDKVTALDEKGIITLVTEIPNYSGDKYLDYNYQVSFEDDTYMELSYEDIDAGWKNINLKTKNDN